MPPASRQVGVGDGDRPLPEQVGEALLEVDVLARADRRRDRLRQPPVLVGELPGEHVLVPGQREPVERPPQADAGLQAQVAEVVGGQRDLVADLLAHLRHVLAEQVDAAVGDLQAGERVHHAVGVEHPRRCDHAVAAAGEQADAEVHLQEAEAHLHALLQPAAHLAAAGEGVVSQ